MTKFVEVKHTNPDGSIVTYYKATSATVGEGAKVGARAMVGEGATVGARATVGDGATVGEWATVGTRATVGARAMVGEWAKVAPRQARFASRSDGCVFTVAEVAGELRVFAGCRNFNLAEAKAHWNAKHKHGAETRRILDFLFLVTP